MRRDEATQEILFDLDSEDGSDWREAYKELVETPIGQKYLTEYFDEENRDADANKILRAVNVLFSPADGHASVSQLAQALAKVILSGKIQPVQRRQATPLAAPVAADPTPTPKLTGSQKVWKEFREWSEAHSSSECRLRARSDEAYGKFYRKNLEREFAEQPVGDAVEAAGQVARAGNASAELATFVRKYHAEPVSNLRARGGFVTLAGEQIPWATYQETLNRAAAAGLL